MGFTMDGTFVNTIVKGGYAHRQGLEVGSQFVFYERKQSYLSCLQNCLKMNLQKRNFVEVFDGDEILNHWQDSELHTMVFRDESCNGRDDRIPLRPVSNLKKCLDMTDDTSYCFEEQNRVTGV